jgi:hypothetical protein
MPPPPISEWPQHSSLPKVLRSRRGFPALSWYSPFQAFRTAPSFLRTSRHLTQEPPLASDATGIVYPITRPVPLPEFMPFRGFSSTGASALSGLVLPCLFSRLRSVTHQMESLAVITVKQQLPIPLLGFRRPAGFLRHGYPPASGRFPSCCHCRHLSLPCTSTACSLSLQAPFPRFHCVLRSSVTDATVTRLP